MCDLGSYVTVYSTPNAWHLTVSINKHANTDHKYTIMNILVKSFNKDLKINSEINLLSFSKPIEPYLSLGVWGREGSYDSTVLCVYVCVCVTACVCVIFGRPDHDKRSAREHTGDKTFAAGQMMLHVTVPQGSVDQQNQNWPHAHPPPPPLKQQQQEFE